MISPRRRVVLAPLIAILGIAAVLVGVWRVNGRSTRHERAHGESRSREAIPPAAQVSTAAATLDAGDREAFERMSRQPLHDLVVLTYHDVRPPGGDRAGAPSANSPLRATPAQFAEQMAMLHAAGFHTITANDLARALRGEPLPERPLLLTFDDGTKGTWIYADKVLERYGFHAFAMVITGRIGTGQPYYLTWSEVTAMARSGRWDVESHTRDGHHQIAIDAAGHRAPFLVSRAWRPNDGRLETNDEYAQRVREDLSGSVSDILDHGLARPHFFAYPFSVGESRVRDQATASALQRILDAEFLAKFDNVHPFRAVSRRDLATTRVLPRIEVRSDTTTRGLFDALVGAVPLRLEQQEPFSAPGSWSDRRGQPVEGLSFAGASAQMQPLAPGKWLAAYFAVGGSADWGGYRETVRVEGLGLATSGSAAQVVALAGSSSPVSLKVSSDEASLSVGSARVARQRLGAAPAHDVSLTVNADAVIAIVDGRTVARYAFPAQGEAARTGGIEVMALRRQPADGAVTFTGLELVPVAIR